MNVPVFVLVFMQIFLMQLDLIRLFASYKPVIVSAKVSERIITIINSLSVLQMPLQVCSYLFCRAPYI